MMDYKAKELHRHTVVITDVILALLFQQLQALPWQNFMECSQYSFEQWFDSMFFYEIGDNR